MPALASAWKSLSSDLLIPSDVRDFYSLLFLPFGSASPPSGPHLPFLVHTKVLPDESLLSCELVSASPSGQ